MAKQNAPTPPPRRPPGPEPDADMIGLIRRIRQTRTRPKAEPLESFPQWSLRQVKRALREAAVRPNRRLGQNFLADPQLLDAIVRDAEVRPGERVLEVGPGIGGLTAPLLSAGARVLGVEIDERLARILELRFRGAGDLRGAGGLEVLTGDVLCKGSISGAVLERLDGPFKVVSNLPYSAGTAFLMDLIIRPGIPWTRAVCTVQREVADRFASPPGSRAYGLTSVVGQTFCEIRLRRKVPREVFWPRPKVASALIDLRPRDDPPLPDALRQPFSDFCKSLFTQRRKKLSNSLASALPKDADVSAADLLAAAGVDERLRVEALPPEQLVALFHQVRARTS